MYISSIKKIYFLITHLFLPGIFRTYHEFTERESYVKPDLAIAFDSGSSQDDSLLWQETMERLVDFAIPSVFTVNLFILLLNFLF